MTSCCPADGLLPFLLLMGLAEAVGLRAPFGGSILNTYICPSRFLDGRLGRGF